MKKQFLLLSAALIFFVSMSTFAQVQDFTLVNKTGVTIHHVYITQHDSDTWGEDILGKDVFMDGDETDVSFHPIEDVCLWDLKIDDADGNAIQWSSIDLCKWVTVTLHWDGSKATATFD
ncbi:MAG: hypothetical protein CVV24_06035 [Ignavibacteriae bacterium HGW-Ignavibacteriae-3]|nr:MAG: hypothetical protein CVV24_06035 [Ignavibacteriae bacterium HGW-Ignavibacteriae-3]